MNQSTLPADVDAQLGRRVRERRALLGITQEVLARRLGIAPQQLQKYEIGENRISASRLIHIAEVLGVDCSFFYKGLSDKFPVSQKEECFAGLVETLEMSIAFNNLKNKRIRRDLIQLVKTLADRSS